LSWKQEFVGNIDDDESQNCVIPPKPNPISNSDYCLTEVTFTEM